MVSVENKFQWRPSVLKGNTIDLSEAGGKIPRNGIYAERRPNPTHAKLCVTQTEIRMPQGMIKMKVFSKEQFSPLNWKKGCIHFYGRR